MSGRSAIVVRFGRSHRPDDLDALAVEVACEFAVAVTGQEAKRRRTLLQGPDELAGPLGDPRSGWVRGTPLRDGHAGFLAR